jgi:hypothetical protein
VTIPTGKSATNPETRNPRAGWTAGRHGQESNLRPSDLRSDALPLRYHVSQEQGSIMTTHSIGLGCRGGVHVKMQGGAVCGCSAPIPPPFSLIVRWSTSPGKQACHAIGILTHLGHALAKRACLGGLGPRQHQEVHFAKPAPRLHHIRHMPQHLHAPRATQVVGAAA